MIKSLLFFQGVATWLLIGLFEAYRLIFSPLLGVNCRHLPTCSQYAKDAVIVYGPLHGSYYAFKRILRCHPWAKPMLDPVLPIPDGRSSAEHVNTKPKVR